MNREALYYVQRAIVNDYDDIDIYSIKYIICICKIDK